LSTERKVTWKTGLAYGVGDIYGAGSFMIIGLLFMFYLTEFAGIPPAWAGIIFGIGKGWDALTDPLMGILSDRTKSPFGRRRIYFLTGIIPIALTFYLLWTPSPLSSTPGKILYYALAYMLFSTVFTTVMVPYTALNADISSDYRIRTKLTGYRSLLAQVSNLLAGTLPRIIIGFYPQNPRLGYQVMGLVFGIIYALPWFLVFKGTWEEKLETDPYRITWGNFFTVFKNRSYRIQMGMYIAAYTALDILMAMFIYFLTYYMKRPGLYTLALGSLLFVQISCLPLHIYLSNKLGKAAVYRLGMILWAGASLLMLLLLGPGSSVILVVLLCVLLGAGLSAASMTPWAMLPSITDVDELITGKNRVGLYAGTMTLFRKMVQGVLAMPLIGWFLDGIGYQPGVEQSPLAQEGIRYFFALGPLAFILVGIGISLLFPITPETHKVLKREIQRRRVNSSQNQQEGDQAVCEKLTGIPAAFWDLTG